MYSHPRLDVHLSETDKANNHVNEIVEWTWFTCTSTEVQFRNLISDISVLTMIM